MNIGPLYETLILIEHKGTIRKNNLFDYASRSTRGVIGKMEAMSLIEKTDSGDISLSKKGHRYLNRVLGNLHDSIIKWDGQWTIVSFGIPEKKRSARDKFRRFIGSIGMKPLFSSLWISPLELSSVILQYVRANGISENVLIVRSNKLSGIGVEAAMKLWKFDKHRADLERFISESRLPFKEGSDRAFEVKKRIFAFALILDNQPKIPFEFLPEDWPYLRARMAYKRLKAMLS